MSSSRAHLARAASQASKRISPVLSTSETKPEGPARKRARKTAATVTTTTTDLASADDAEKSTLAPIGVPETEAATALASVPEAPLTVHVPLAFDFSAAREHLIRADTRFATLFEQLPCKPFDQPGEALEHVHPFRDLASSILGQQVRLPFSGSNFTESR
jgi:DNA-3-methyladenine glycosylase II